MSRNDTDYNETTVNKNIFISVEGDKTNIAWQNFSNAIEVLVVLDTAMGAVKQKLASEARVEGNVIRPPFLIPRKG